MSNIEPEEDLVDQIFGTTEYALQAPYVKTFLPWHRPRKQFVRNHQWCEQMVKLLEEYTPGNQTLKYFGLPGIDLLDIRYFHDQVCLPKGLRFRYLGFNSGIHPSNIENTDFNVSLDEVHKLSLIDPTSEIIWDDFCSISNSSSIAWNKAKSFGPYDVINLDLCDGFGLHPPGGFENTHYNAVNSLLSIQSRNMNPWILLLTTRVGKSHTHPDTLKTLIEKYISNLQLHADFKAESIGKFNIDTSESLNTAIEQEDGLLKVFLVGLCKWFMGLAVAQNPPTKVEVKSVLGYSVETTAECEDLISIALKFIPTFLPSEDALGLANAIRSNPDECKMAIQAIGQVSRRKNVDSILLGDETLNKEMIKESGALLELARYDVDAYYAWINSPSAVAL